MNVTIDVQAERIGRNTYKLFGYADFTVAYTTGGFAVTEITKHFIKCLMIIFNPTGGYNFSVDFTTNKVLVYLPAGTEVVNGTVLALSGVRFEATGVR